MAKVNIRTTADRRQAGKSLRQKCPRASHGKVILGQGEKRDIVALIEASNKDRLENLNEVPGWPTLPVRIGTASVHLPDILVLPETGN